MKIDSENSQHFSKIKFFGINNVIFLDDEFQFFDNMTISISGDNNTIKIAQVKITQRGKLNIHISGNNNNIEIGDAVIINHNMSLSFFAGGIGASANNCSIKISSKSFFNGNISLICGEENTHISIGEDCLFANNIKLTTTDNHSIYDLSNGERVNKGGDVRIGNHCWICEDVTFLNNSSVADNCVVATKSLVTKPLLSSYCCYGGIPAIIIRKNINWNREIRNYWGGGKINLLHNQIGDRMITTINNNKKIGVIIPIYNVEKYLRECLDSVVNQTYTHLVIVLVNDGSSDSSFEIAKEYALYDDRIILFNKNNGGQGSARNVGINFFKKEYEFELIDDKESFYTFEVESGEDNLKVMRNKNAFKTLNFKKFQVSDIDYLMFLDSDDYWALDCVESCLEKINGVDLVWYGIGWFGKSRLDFECNTTITNIEWLERMIEKGIGYFWNANFFMADFKLFKNYKLHFINHIIFEDHIFGIELFTRAEKIYILNKTLYYYRTRPNSTSNHNRKVTKEQISPYFNFLCEDFKDNYEQTKAYFKAASVLIYVERLVDFIQKLSDNKLQSLLKKAFLKHYLECSLLEFSRIYKDPMHISHTICVFIDEEYENNIKPFSKSSKGEILLWIQRVLREKYHTINNSQLQNSILNTKLKIIEMRANYGTASSRLKSHLAYKLGEAMILNSKSLLGYIRMPYVLSYIKDKHNKEQKQYQEKINKNPKLKLPPLESYSDYKESLKIKTTLSYKLGEALIKAYKQNFFKFPLPFIANNTNYNGGGGHTMVLFNRI